MCHPKSWGRHGSQHQIQFKLSIFNPQSPNGWQSTSASQTPWLTKLLNIGWTTGSSENSTALRCWLICLPTSRCRKGGMDTVYTVQYTKVILLQVKYCNASPRVATQRDMRQIIRTSSPSESNLWTLWNFDSSSSQYCTEGGGQWVSSSLVFCLNFWGNLWVRVRVSDCWLEEHTLLCYNGTAIGSCYFALAKGPESRQRLTWKSNMSAHKLFDWAKFCFDQGEALLVLLDALAPLMTETTVFYQARIPSRLSRYSYDWKGSSPTRPRCKIFHDFPAKASRYTVL